MDVSYLASSIFALSGIGCGFYLLFYILFRRSIVSFTDPVNYGIAIVSFYLAGALFVPTLGTVNRSYSYVVFLIILYVVVGAGSSGKYSPKIPLRLSTPPQFQRFFATALTGLLVLNLVINQMFGVIAIFRGTQSRADYGSVASPSLYLLSSDLGLLALLLFLLTTDERVRLWTGTGVGVSVISTILGGSKSALLSILFLFSIADYVLNLKLISAPTQDRPRLTKTIRTIRRRGFLCAIGIALLLPFYLVLIKADQGTGSQGSITLFATRLFGGFDGLAIIAAKDIDITSVQGVHLMDYYLYPFLKKFASTPQFQSAGEYLIYLLTDNYEFAQSGMNPNSTFPIELLLSNGNIVVSGILIIATTVAVFRVRMHVLARNGVRIIDLVLWVFFVLAPFSILLDGAYSIIRFYLLIGLYLILNSAANGLAWLTPGRKLYRLL